MRGMTLGCIWIGIGLLGIFRRNEMNEQQRAVVKQALDAFELVQRDVHWMNKSPTQKACRKAEKALRQLLEQPVQEPVAITEADIQKWQGDNDVVMSIKAYKQLVKMVSCKPAQPAVPLTDEQTKLLWHKARLCMGSNRQTVFKNLIEAHHGITAAPTQGEAK
jgi:hypothetical protein